MTGGSSACRQSTSVLVGPGRPAVVPAGPCRSWNRAGWGRSPLCSSCLTLKARRKCIIILNLRFTSRDCGMSTVEMMRDNKLEHLPIIRYHLPRQSECIRQLNFIAFSVNLAKTVVSCLLNLSTKYPAKTLSPSRDAGFEPWIIILYVRY